MEPKDFVTLLISGATFILAVVLAITTARSGKADEQRTIRNQLTDTLNHLFEIYLKLGQQQVSGFGNSGQAQNTTSLLHQQYISLLGQATFLANKKVIKKLVTPVEYNTLAVSNAVEGEFKLANTYARNAINACDKDDVIFKIRATSSYGTILFMQSNFEEGNAKFNDALDLLKKAEIEKNYAHYLKGWVYVMWATFEKQWNAPGGTPDAHFKAAETAFNEIEIPRNKAVALHELEQARETADSSTLQNIGNAQGVQMQQSIFDQIRTPGWPQKP
jgi:tetratricopeptide (TPR) repeat protein